MNGAEDYLCEDRYRPEWLKEGVTESTIESVLSRRHVIRSIAEELAPSERFYLIGSGGSYAVQHPIRYVAERYTDAPVHQFSGWEFLERKPASVGPGAACIFISHSGRTREVLRALEWAKKRGATTLGIAQHDDAPICAKADHGFGTVSRGVTIGKLASLYLLFGDMFVSKGFEVGSRLIELAGSLPDVLPGMISPAKERARRLGLEFKDERHVFVVGGGVNYGLAYQFSLCTLMEMCWVNSTPVDYSEFRHGPIEMFAPESAAVFLRGRGDEGELEDAVVDFARGNGVHLVVCDSLGLEVDNLLTPFTLFVELEWFSYFLSLARNRNMERWRYYDRVEF